jgi:hypothetical protein
VCADHPKTFPQQARYFAAPQTHLIDIYTEKDRKYYTNARTKLNWKYENILKLP